MRLWFTDTDTGEVVRTLTGHRNMVKCVAFSADSKFDVSGSADKSVNIWSTDTGKVVSTLRGRGIREQCRW